MKLLGSVVLLMLFVVIVPLYSQIVIDWTEMPHYIGTEWTKNGKDSVSIDLGSPGGPQTWNFTSQPMGTESEDLFIVPVSSTPFADSFPDANLVYMSFAGSDTVYQYYELIPDFMSTLGLGGLGPDTNFLLQYEPIDSAPLPLSYGNSRHFHYGFSIAEGTDSLRFDHYGFQICDAYGTVIIPYGNFECLRICDFDTCVMTAFISGVPVFSDTITYIVYGFPAEDYGAVVCIKSYPDETNPNYTEALNLDRLTYFSTGIEEFTTCTKSSFSLYPNPFSDYLTINYSLAKTCVVNLRIYDINGRLLGTVVNTSQAQGSYSVKWYGKDENDNSLPNGVYFYHLNIDETSLTGKMLMLK